MLETNLDDISAQVVGHIYDALFAAGALDVFTSPVHMKKNRTGVQLTVLAPCHLREAMEAILFRETTTFGVRAHRCERRKLERTFETVQTPAGPVRIKIGRSAGKVLTATPEYDDCRQAALKADLPLKEVMDLAMRTWRASRQDVLG